MLADALDHYFSTSETRRMSNSKESEIFSTLYYLESYLKSLKYPAGSRENPARTCRDLVECRLVEKDGTFWVDPNLGCSHDALQAQCKLAEGGMTCLSPSTDIEFEYPVSKVQMNFLHLLSSEVTQGVKVHCNNVSVWRNSGHSVKFKGWDGKVYEYGSHGNQDIKIDYDGCRTLDGTWGMTHFTFRTQDVTQLPIVDVIVGGYSSHSGHVPDSTVKIEIEPVCFW
ncbi:collagen alpha-1(XXVII) chain-like [Saccoglossus kowalevskii]|uniref:Collagen alpha-1(XXVII) chain-like n=1 Tax=Saccoglossus kowalevskii TaxID=10224 RepID=A0ABM0M2U8_SACKO|nr:PREDICTED: collagen alpha-1(XXVII) chain-like [Saccoglossus kowalevskii]